MQAHILSFAPLLLALSLTLACREPTPIQQGPKPTLQVSAVLDTSGSAAQEPQARCHSLTAMLRRLVHKHGASQMELSVWTTQSLPTPQALLVQRRWDKQTRSAFKGDTSGELLEDWLKQTQEACAAQIKPSESSALLAAVRTAASELEGRCQDNHCQPPVLLVLSDLVEGEDVALRRLLRGQSLHRSQDKALRPLDLLPQAQVSVCGLAQNTLRNAPDPTLVTRIWRQRIFGPDASVTFTPACPAPQHAQLQTQEGRHD